MSKYAHMTEREIIKARGQLARVLNDPNRHPATDLGKVQQLIEDYDNELDRRADGCHF